MPDNRYDAIIIGGGPGGLTAGLYCARSGLRAVVIERGLVGGQMNLTDRIENFPGFPDGITGMDLGQRMAQQAEKHGLTTVLAEVTGFDLSGREKSVQTSEGEFRAPALIVTSGAEHQKLNIPGEEKLAGRGVSYCAMCDAAFFRDQKVAIVGGGDTAVTEALHLAKFARKVVLIHRRRQMRADKVLQERVVSDPKMEFLWDTVIEEIVGDGEVRAVRLREARTGEVNELLVNGVFVAVGFVPNSNLLAGRVHMDEGGHIKVNLWMETNVPGVFAAGDVRQHSGKQAITAAGDGATAAIAAERYLAHLQG